MIAQSRPFYINGDQDPHTDGPTISFDNGDPVDYDPTQWGVITKYDDLGRILTQRSANGAILTNIYDDDKGIYKTIDSFGMVSVWKADLDTGQMLATWTTDGDSEDRYDYLTYSYNDFGQQTSIVQILKDGTSIALSESNYDDDGFLNWTESIGGLRQYFVYNKNGFQTHSWRNIPDPQGDGSSFVTAVSVNFEQSTGPVVDPPYGPPPTEHAPQGGYFEVRGDVEFTHENFTNLKTLLGQYETNDDVARLADPGQIMNDRGITVQSRSLTVDDDGSQQWIISQRAIEYKTVMGEPIGAKIDVEYQVDDYVEGTPIEDITGSRSFYDDEGRVVKSELLIGLNIQVVEGDGVGYGETQVNGFNRILSRTETAYDDLGRIELTRTYPFIPYDEHGEPVENPPFLKSWTTENLKGQTVESYSESWGRDQNSTIEWKSLTVYDEFDRVEYQTDSFVDGDVVYATRTIYDDTTGEAIGSARHKNVVITFDDHGNTRVEVGNEGEIVYESRSFFDRGRTTKTIDSRGGVTEFEYDSLGRQTATIGPAVLVAGEEIRHRTESVYDERGRVIAQISNIAVDADGIVDDSEAQRTEYIFDEIGRVERTIFDDGSFSQTRYDAEGRVVAESQQVGADNEIEWSTGDSSYRVVGTTDLIPTRTQEYNSRGQLVAVELPAVPNAQGDDERPRYEYGYDIHGNQDLIRDPLDHETHFTFDENGRQVTRSIPMAFGSDHDDTRGERAEGEDPNGFTERFEYDDLGRQWLHVTFEDVYVVSVYDDVTGRTTEVHYYRDANSFDLNYTQQPADEPNPDEKRIYTFNSRGQIAQIVHEVGGSVVRTETTTYTEEGQVWQITNDEGFIEYRYDDFGQMQSMSSYGNGYVPISEAPFENVVEYGYDDLGRLESVSSLQLLKDQTTDVTVYAYDLLGNMDRTTNSAGLIHDYQFDSLNRLEELTHWIDSDGDGQLGDGEIQSRYEYLVRDDGKRSGAIETHYDYVEPGASGNDSVYTNTFSWVYDDAGRLISETLLSVSDGGLFGGSNGQTDSYTLNWTYDLTGNRKVQEKDIDSDGSIEETTTYEYNANDQLIEEAVTFLIGNDKVTRYEYVDPATGIHGTQQREKTVWEPVTSQSGSGFSVTRQTLGYNLQGRMSSVVVESGSSSDVSEPNSWSSESSTTYEYDSSGNRVAKEVSSNGATVRTEYLTDEQNHTGYSQVLQETTTSLDGSIKKIVYTIGHDQISQTVSDYDPNANSGAGEWSEAVTHHFATDGHGSVRALYGLKEVFDGNMSTEEVFQVLESYIFDAYGNLLNFADATPLTSYLYSGEAFDLNLDQQYLRARWYDAANGRFNRLDPFAGNDSDPQSFHKYAYVHGDPISNIDPTGEFSLVGLAIGITAQLLPGPGDFVEAGLTSLVQAYAVNLQWDVEWAQDFSLPDNLSSRNSDDWVFAALAGGIKDTFTYSIPFTGIQFNLADILFNLSNNLFDPNAGLGMSYDEFFGHDAVAGG